MSGTPCPAAKISPCSRMDTTVVMRESTPMTSPVDICSSII